MTQLTPLRDQLTTLRRRRHGVRLGTAWVAVAVAVLWTLAVIFLIDWQLSMSRVQRIVAIAAGLAAIAWAYRRYAAPLLAQRETDLDMALMVERQQGIDSDLVAALQFESPEAKRWGSTQLEGAVIGYVAEFSRGWNLLEGFSAQQFVRRGVALAVTLAVVLAAVLWQPRYAATFLSRLALGSQHYPTRTEIDELKVNGAVVAVEGDKTIHAGYGQPIDFAVRISGDLPADVRKVELRSTSSGVSRPVELTAESSSTAKSSAAAGSSSSAGTVFRGQLPQLVDSLEFQVYLGDAWTDPGQLVVIPLPVVEPKLTATPPKYARSMKSASDEEGAGSRQLSVLEGSQIDLEIQCLNKTLSDAKLTIDKKDFALEKADTDGHRWKLPSKDSPLAHIDSPVKYQIQVTDEDGLHLPHPLDGYIRIKADRPPTIMASVDVQYFLPDSGNPAINFTVNDDYGVSKVNLYAEVSHAPPESANGDATAAPAAPADQPPPVATNPPDASAGVAASKPLGPIAVPLPKSPLLQADLKKNGYNGVYRLPLSQFKLAKGDVLRVTLEAIDYRGDDPGKATRSDPVVLQITDESGIMTALGETDLRAAHQLDLLIQRQSQTGGSK